MSDDPSKKTKIMEIPGFSYSVDDLTIVQMERWHYYTDRGRLWLISGYYSSKKKLEEAISKCASEDSGIPVEGCPKHFPLRADRWIL